jgi:hypothetical protein
VTVDGQSITELARQFTHKALEALVSVLDNEEAPASAKVQAATAVLDRGFGKPRQEMGIEMKPDQATASMLEQARKRAALTVLPVLPSD